MISTAIVVLVVALFINVWFLYTNHLTLNQRMKIIDYNDYNMPIGKRLDRFDELDKVSYHRHHWHVMTFRDWRKLYPKLGTMI